MKLENHFFPDFQISLPNCSAGDEDPSTLFRPLHPSSLSNAFWNEWHNQADPADDSLEQERQKGFQKGFEDGRLEGGKLAKATLTPEYERFLNAYKRLTAQTTQYALMAGTQIVRMTLAVVERILGPDIHIRESDLTPLPSLLQKAMIQNYRLTLYMNPADVQQLREIAAQNSLQWPAVCQEVNFASDPTLAQGGLRVEHQAGSFRSVVEQAAGGLAEILAASVGA